MNLHSIGACLQNAMRPEVAAHDIYLRRGKQNVGQTSEVFQASSPPIGQRLLTDTGLELSEHDRVFFFEARLLGIFGLPRKGDVAIDLSDDSAWRILPQGNDAAWRWHGQSRTMIQILCKADNF